MLLFGRIAMKSFPKAIRYFISLLSLCSRISWFNWPLSQSSILILLRRPLLTNKISKISDLISDQKEEFQFFKNIQLSEYSLFKTWDIQSLHLWSRTWQVSKVSYAMDALSGENLILGCRQIHCLTWMDVFSHTQTICLFMPLCTWQVIHANMGQNYATSRRDNSSGIKEGWMYWASRQHLPIHASLQLPIHHRPSFPIIIPTRLVSLYSIDQDNPILGIDMCIYGPRYTLWS